MQAQLELGYRDRNHPVIFRGSVRTSVQCEVTVDLPVKSLGETTRRMTVEELERLSALKLLDRTGSSGALIPPAPASASLTI